MNMEQQEVGVPATSMADVPPIPSILEMLESAHYYRVSEAAKEKAAKDKKRDSNTTGVATKAVEKHMPEVHAYLRRRGRWTWTKDIRDEIQRQHGVTLDCAVLANKLRKIGVEERPSGDQCQWRVLKDAN